MPALGADRRPHVDKRVTSSDVARLAAVSRSAVSRAFTPGGVVAESTRRKVYEAAERLGYRPNAIARMLIKRRSDLVGVVLGSLTNQFLSVLAARLIEAIHRAGLRPLLFQAASRIELDRLLPQVSQYQVSAILTTGFTPHPEVAASCARAGAPVIVVNRATPPGYPGISIATDHVGGGRLAADVLLDAGYGRIAVLLGDESMSTHQARLAGFEGRLAERGTAAFAIDTGPFTFERGMDRAMSLFAGPERPDAVFCSGDLIALGALDALRVRLRLRVPDDVGVLGFDDIPTAAWPAYDLTTIRQPLDEIVVAVGEHLDSVDSPRPEPVRLLFAPSLVLRSTLRPSACRPAASALA